MPLPSAAQYLMDIFFAIGPVNGEEPIRFAEIDAYSRLTAANLEPWEATTLSEMSRAYREEMFAATNPLSIEPMERDYA